MALNATKSGNSVKVARIAILRNMRKANTALQKLLATPNADTRWKNTEKATQIIEIAQSFRDMSPQYAEAVSRIFLTLAGEEITTRTNVAPYKKTDTLVDGCVIVLSKAVNDYPANTPILYTERVGYVVANNRGGHGAGLGGSVTTLRSMLRGTNPQARLATEEELVQFHNDLVNFLPAQALDSLETEDYYSIYHRCNRVI